LQPPVGSVAVPQVKETTMSVFTRAADRLLDRLAPKGKARAGLDFFVCENGRWLHCRSGVGCVDTGETC
jgi:hypothetical protein